MNVLKTRIKLPGLNRCQTNILALAVTLATPILMFPPLLTPSEGFTDFHADSISSPRFKFLGRSYGILGGKSEAGTDDAQWRFELYALAASTIVCITLGGWHRRSSPQEPLGEVKPKMEVE